MGSSWEAAVRWYRAQPGNEAAVRDNYFDLPVRDAAERYARGEEFAEVARLLGRATGRALDVGAGHGIASFALARFGWTTVAVEPDPSDEVGAGAVRQLATETRLPLHAVRGTAEALPFPSETFAVVHARQVLHHTRDLGRAASEMWRVLRKGGKLLATREHVADDEAQLAAFRDGHPLHHRYGGENAHPQWRYEQALRDAGFRLERSWGPYESPVNFYPGTEAQRRRLAVHLAFRLWLGLGVLVSWSQRVQDLAARRASERDQTPGRIFTFLASKP